MKFRVGDIVIEKYGWYRRGKVVRAVRDPYSSTGEFYLVDFGGRSGNVWANGSHFAKACEKSTEAKF